MKKLQNVEAFLFQNLIIYDRITVMQDRKDARKLGWMHPILNCAYVYVRMCVCMRARLCWGGQRELNLSLNT